MAPRTPPYLDKPSSDHREQCKTTNKEEERFSSAPRTRDAISLQRALMLILLPIRCVHKIRIHTAQRGASNKGDGLLSPTPLCGACGQRTRDFSSPPHSLLLALPWTKTRLCTGPEHAADQQDAALSSIRRLQRVWWAV